MIKQLFSKYKWYLIGGAVIFVVLIPLGINALFKFPAVLPLFSAEWSASDALSFYSAILTAIIGVIGVYWSIQAAQKNYREDEVNKVRPYFAITVLVAKSQYGFFNGIENVLNSKSGSEQSASTESLYDEYKLERAYIVISENGISFVDRLTNEQDELLQSGGWGWKSEGKKRYKLQAHNLVSIPFELENVGAGVALNVWIAFYKEGSNKRGLSAYTFKPNQCFYCHVFSDNPSESLYGKYILEIYYVDIMGNGYSQKFPIEFGKKPEDDKFYNSITLIGEQEAISNGQT